MSICVQAVYCATLRHAYELVIVVVGGPVLVTCVPATLAKREIRTPAISLGLRVMMPLCQCSGFSAVCGTQEAWWQKYGLKVSLLKC